MAIFKCKMCGGQLEIAEDAKVAICEYCGTEQTLPRLDSDRKANLYDRANHFRRNNDYDKAMSIYEQVLNEDSTDSEAYWSLVLCRYGIEYVEDPLSKKRIPTVNRAQFTSIFADEDYKSAIQYADIRQREVYEQEAKNIDDIQRGILAISEKEEPFDVFICYKETDETGKRTPDSVLANDLYHQLTQEDFKVFFARITLEDKLGQEFEPYIFAALHSAKVMVVLGTKPEHFNSVWVKNEWSRYISLIAKGEKKMLIPAYKDMDPYDLPEEFSHLQAQDMTKLGFMQDIIRGIRKIIGVEKRENTIPKENIVISNQSVTGGGNSTALLKRGNMALDDGEWQKADSFFEEVLNQDAECSEAYIGKLLIKYEKRNIVSYISYIESKYSEFESREYYACNTDEAHISEMVDKYSINKYLEPEQIYPLYDFDSRYESILKSIGQQKENAISDVTNEKNFIRAKQYSKGQTVKVINSIIDTISMDYDKKINEAQRIDDNKIASIQKAYSQHINEADMTVKEKFQRAVKKREEDYQSIIEQFNEAKSVEAFKIVKSKFNKMDGYEESLSYVQRCDDEILRITEEFELFQRRKRIIIASIIGIVSIVVAAFCLIKFVLLPNYNYNRACSLLEEKKYDEAIDIFAGLDTFKDSCNQLNEAKYQKAGDMLLSQDYDGAIALYGEIGEYSDSEAQKLEAQYQKANALLSTDVNQALELFNSLGEYKDSSERVNELKYNIAVYQLQNNDYQGALETFNSIKDYNDSAEKINEITYGLAKEHLNAKEYDKAIEEFTAIKNYKDSNKQLKLAKYKKGNILLKSKKYYDAIKLFEEIGNYKDSKSKIKECYYKKASELLNKKWYNKAIGLLKKLGNYKNSKEMLKKAQYKYAIEKYEKGSYSDAIELFEDLGNYKDSAYRLSQAYAAERNDNNDYYDEEDDEDDYYYDEDDDYSYDGYVLPQSSSRLLTESDLYGLSKEELRIARNEIYARNGRRFVDEELQAYFDSMDWYDGYIEPEDFNENEMLTQTERDNTRFIKEYE